MISLSHQKFVAQATHSAVIHAITSQIGHVSTVNAVVSGPIASDAAATHATRAVTAVAARKMFAARSGCASARSVILPMTSVTDCMKPFSFSFSLVPIAIWRPSNAETSCLIVHLKLSRIIFACSARAPFEFAMASAYSAKPSAH